jgi:hypothetical protein
MDSLTVKDFLHFEQTMDTGFLLKLIRGENSKTSAIKNKWTEELFAASKASPHQVFIRASSFGCQFVGNGYPSPRVKHCSASAHPLSTDEFLSGELVAERGAAAAQA